MNITDRVRKLQEAGRELERRKSKINSSLWAMQSALLDLAAEALGRDDDVEGGDQWECENKENPIGMCVYDGHEDPAWDDCLFCHEPFERK